MSDISQFKYFRLRQRYGKWIVYLSKDGKTFNYEIGPFDYLEALSYCKEELESLIDKDKDVEAFDKNASDKTAA